MNLHDIMTVTVPEGACNGMEVKRFEVAPNNLNNLREALRGGRQTRPGWYTKLVGDGNLWMSDTDAEKRDHMEPLLMIQRCRAERVLLNGLGLGMVLQATLTFEHVRHVDVVECDERVIRLVGPHYTRDERVHIHHADAHEQAKGWPSGTRWDVGWSDIWGDYSVDDLPGMQRLNRSYGRRCGWHRCWQQDYLQHRAREERRYRFP